VPVELTVVETAVELTAAGESNVELTLTEVDVILQSASAPGPQGPPGSGGVIDADYLVGTVHAGLSAEIVVGTSPGGELGGTWASPTVDATHSGSTHAAVQAAAEATAAGALATHTADTTAVHGIADTSALVVDGDAAGGVLGGTYPNPSFAADMATQAELDAHVNDTSAAHAASAISVSSTTLMGTGTDVQAVFEELDNLLDDHSARHELGGADELNIDPTLISSGEEGDFLFTGSGSVVQWGFPSIPAANISVDSTALSGTGVNIQAVVEELDNLLDDHSARHENGGADEISIAGLDGTSVELAAHLADTADAHDASAISIADAGGDFTATDVEGALAELQADAEALTAYSQPTISATNTDVATPSGTKFFYVNAINDGGTIRSVGAPATDGSLMILRASSGGSVTLEHNEAGGAGQRFWLLTGADTAIPQNYSVTFVSQAGYWVQTGDYYNTALDAHLADTVDAHDASAISVVSTTLSGTGADVQAVFEEIDNLLDDHSARHENGGGDELSLAGLDGTSVELAAHIADTTAAHAASAISVSSTTLMGTGTDVQAVFEELDNSIDALRTASINYVIDGGGATITTGVKGDLVIDFACVIQSATLLADQSGSIVVNVWKDTYANYPPVVGDKITASAPPTISTATKSQDATLTGWTTSIAAGDTLRFNVDSVTTIQRVTLALKVLRTV
jgi:hypothetical protein